MGTSKDADMSPFEAGRRLLSHETARMSLMDRTELVFQDMDIVPLLIQVPHILFLCLLLCIHGLACPLLKSNGGLRGKGTLRDLCYA